MLGTKVHEMGASGLGVPAQEVESIQPGVWACVMETSLSCEPAQEMEGSLPEDLPPAATDVRFRLSSEQRGRFEAMIEKLRKLGEKGDRTELMLEAMALLVLERTEARRCERIEAKHRDHSSRIAEVYREPAAPPAPRASAGVDGAPTPESASRLALGNPNPPNVLPENTPRVHSSRAVLPVYQVYVRSCEQCDRGWLETTTGSQLLDTATLRAILCDCRVSRPGEPNQHAIPPRLRREALERDGYRCRARGCGSHRFLNVHHMHATADGGPHRIDNVITVCNPCHTLVHGLRGNEPALVRELTVASRAAVL